jgi:hypothetical protein
LESQLALMWKPVRRALASEHSSLKQLMTLTGTDMSHLQTIANAVERENGTIMLKMDIIKAWICCHEQRMRLIQEMGLGQSLVAPAGLCRLALSACNITDGALAACLDGLSSLRSLALGEIMTLTTLPSQLVLQRLRKLKNLSIRSCWCLRSLGGLRAATSLSEISLFGCPSLELARGADFLPSSLKEITIHECVVAANFFSGDLRHLRELSMYNCKSSASLSIGHLTSLGSLSVGCLPDLCFLEGLSSLQLLHVHLTGVPKLDAKCISQFQVQKTLYVSSPALLNHMLSAEGFMLPPFLCLEGFKEPFLSFEVSPKFTSLKWLRFYGSQMRALPGNLKCLSSLTKLDIYSCRNISSLPDLPSSLQHITIWGCELLKQSCPAPDGESWPKIAHIRWKEFK